MTLALGRLSQNSVTNRRFGNQRLFKPIYGLMVGAFSEHGESSRMFVDSSTRGGGHTHYYSTIYPSGHHITDYITFYTEREDQLKYTFLVL